MKELQKKSAPELQKLLAKDREELRSLRFRIMAGQFKNVRRIREVKRDIARIMLTLSKQ